MRTGTSATLGLSEQLSEETDCPRDASAPPATAPVASQDLESQMREAFRSFPSVEYERLLTETFDPAAQRVSAGEKIPQ